MDCGCHVNLGTLIYISEDTVTGYWKMCPKKTLWLFRKVYFPRIWHILNIYFFTFSYLQISWNYKTTLVWSYKSWLGTINAQVINNWRQWPPPPHYLFLWKSCWISIWPVLYQVRTHLLFCSTQGTVHPHIEGEAEIFSLDQDSTAQPTCISCHCLLATLWLFDNVFVFWQLSSSAITYNKESLTTFKYSYTLPYCWPLKAASQRSTSGPRPVYSHFREVFVCLLAMEVWALAFALKLSCQMEWKWGGVILNLGTVYTQQ